MAEVKNAQRVVTLEDIKFNEENKILAAISVVPIIGLVIFFVEKDDLFVRYIAAQFMFFLATALLSFIPVIGWMLLPIFAIVQIVFMVIGFIKALNGERYDVPVLSGWALKAMNSM